MLRCLYRRNRNTCNTSEEQFDINEKNADVISKDVYKGDLDIKAMSVAYSENASACCFIGGRETSNNIEHFSKMVDAVIYFAYQLGPFSDEE